mgnify:CR=1 FL=1
MFQLRILVFLLFLCFESNSLQTWPRPPFLATSILFMSRWINLSWYRPVWSWPTNCTKSIRDNTVGYPCLVHAPRIRLRFWQNHTFSGQHLSTLVDATCNFCWIYGPPRVSLLKGLRAWVRISWLHMSVHQRCFCSCCCLLLFFFFFGWWRDRSETRGDRAGRANDNQRLRTIHTPDATWQRRVVFGGNVKQTTKGTWVVWHGEKEFEICRLFWLCLHCRWCVARSWRAAWWRCRERGEHTQWWTGGILKHFGSRSCQRDRKF